MFGVLQISFSGKVQTKGPTIVAIDNVSFLPQRCEKIPFTKNQSKKPFLPPHLCTHTSMEDQYIQAVPQREMRHESGLAIIVFLTKPVTT